MTIELRSFGFQYGSEIGALVFDARFIPNPYYVDSLRPLDGRDKACEDYVFSFPITQKIFHQLKDIILTMAEGSREKDSQGLKICIGCTGGKHRSVALIEALAREIKAIGYQVSISHREMEAGRY